MTSGIIYMCFGQQACVEASYSIKSFRRFVDYKVCVVGDEWAENHFKSDDKVIFIKCDVNPYDESAPNKFKFMAGRIKPLLAELSPFDKTLYVDADTSFRKSPKFGFDLLDKVDFIVAETQTRSIRDTIAGQEESKYTCDIFENDMMLYHNSGMLFWNKDDSVINLFKEWSNEWQKFHRWDEQVALLRALINTDVLFMTVPYTWNCKYGRDAFFIHHWFGTGTARGDATELDKSRAHKFRSDGSMIRIEVAPNRFVKCHPEDQEKVIQGFRSERR
jgi:hypothetical protein